MIGVKSCVLGNNSNINRKMLSQGGRGRVWTVSKGRNLPKTTRPVGAKTKIGPTQDGRLEMGIMVQLVKPTPEMPVGHKGMILT